MELQETARQLREGMESEARSRYPGLSSSAVDSYVLGQMSYLLAQILDGDARQVEYAKSDLLQSISVAV